MFIDFVTDKLGEPKVATDENMFCCPFCGEEKYKLSVHVSDDSRNNLWHCWHCGEKGNPISFVMKYLQVGFSEAKEILEVYDYSVDTYSLKDIDQSLSPSEQILMLMQSIRTPAVQKDTPLMKELVMPSLPNKFIPLAASLDLPESAPFLNYLHGRGFSTEELLLHNTGYIIQDTIPLPSGKQVTLKNHVVFITHNDYGQPIYWNTRAIYPSIPKTFNAPRDEGTYSTSTVVFNLNIAKKCRDIVVTEGVPDAITVGSSGVGTFGKQIADEQIHLIIKDLAPEQRIFIMLDEDASKESYKIAQRVAEKHKNTYYVFNPYKVDANSMGREKTWEVINKYSKLVTSESSLLRLLY